MKTTFLRISRSLHTAVVVAALGALALVSGARAQGLGLGVATITCTGTETSQYSPGITNTPQNVTFVEKETDSCVDILDPTLTGGSAESSAVENISCTGNAVTGPYQMVFNWTNGQTSVIDVTTTVITKLVSGETQAERTGTVLSGPGAGGNFTQTVTTGNLDLTACSSPQGLVSNSGVAVTPIAAL